MQFVNMVTVFLSLSAVCAMLSWTGEAQALSQTRLSHYRAVPLVKCLRWLHRLCVPAALIAQVGFIVQAFLAHRPDVGVMVAWMLTSLVIAGMLMLFVVYDTRASAAWGSATVFAAAALFLAPYLVDQLVVGLIASLSLAVTAFALARCGTLKHEKFCLQFYG